MKLSTRDLSFTTFEAYRQYVSIQLCQLDVGNHMGEIDKQNLIEKYVDAQLMKHTLLLSFRYKYLRMVVLYSIHLSVMNAKSGDYHRSN